MTLFTLLLTNYSSNNRGGTRRGLHGTRTTLRGRGFGRTGLRVSDVHVLCPGTFRTEGRKIGLVRRISLGRRQGDLVCLSDVVIIGRTRLSSIGNGFILRGSATCRRINGCFCPARAMRGGVNHSFLHKRIGRRKRVSLASVCYTNNALRRATIGIDIKSAFTRAPTSGSDCRAASLNHTVRGTSCGVKRSNNIVTFVMTGGSGGVRLRFVKSHACGATVRPGSHGTVTRLARLTHVLSNVRRVHGSGGRTGLGVRFMAHGVRRRRRRG